jgi:hypothetical protein
MILTLKLPSIGILLFVSHLLGLCMIVQTWRRHASLLDYCLANLLYLQWKFIEVHKFNSILAIQFLYSFDRAPCTTSLKGGQGSEFKRMDI